MRRGAPWDTYPVGFRPAAVATVPDQATIAACLYAIALVLLLYKAVRLWRRGPPPPTGKDWL